MALTSGEKTAKTALENKKSWENGRNRLCGGVERGFHCTVSAHLFPGSCSRVRAEVTHGLGPVCYRCLPWHLPGHGFLQEMPGEASKALQRQGGTHDTISNIQKHQDF